jgi:hypothetical protein
MKSDDAIREVLAAVNYMDYLKQYSKAGSMNYTSREENIEQLVYSASQKESISSFAPLKTGATSWHLIISANKNLPWLNAV